MRIHSLNIQHFRNYSQQKLAWAPHLNLITGPNGAGKTTLIDAIHYLCMSRSFVSTTDQYCVQFDHKGFTIAGDFSGQIRSSFELEIQYARGTGKQFFVNGSKLQKLTDLIGRVPVVVISPEDKLLTSEGPALRRSFLDAFISQLNRPYLDLLLDFKRVLKQRNALLQQAHGRYQPSLLPMLELWNEQLAEKGASILKIRYEVIEAFRSHLQQQYQKIASIPLVPDVHYKSFLAVDNQSTLSQLKEQYVELLNQKVEKEFERGLTLTGPHRDDLIFSLNNRELRHFGSQGQHRLFALSLKMAQLYYYEQELDDLPIFIMDDVFGDIDAEKIDILLGMLKQHEGQLFITAANEKLFDNLSLEDGRDLHLRVKAGQITPAKDE